ncbi:serine hydrolase [Streptomyces sp. NPDC048659]|uniref:serine hydrolase n=1 Tax=Streptomyces sp. NPDC048659 TaxID=3155489 RepID=UPI0034212B95
MINCHRPRLRVWAVLGTVLGALAIPSAAAAHRAPALCSSAREPALATRLSQDIRAALKSREGTVSVAVHAPGRGLRCALSQLRAYDSASIAKVLIMEAVLGRAEELGREPTALEARRLKAMITRSDNEAATDLWVGLSRERMNRVLREAGATDTVLGHDQYWGLTRTTARDQLALLAAVARRPAALALMGQVIRSQSWGVGAGAPKGAKVHLKNGWLPRATHGWRVHSIGIVRGTGLDYRLALLSHDNETMKYGVRTLEGVALAVHRRLGGVPADRGFTPEETISETSDGSVPEAAPTRRTPRPGPPGDRRPEGRTDGRPEGRREGRTRGWPEGWPEERTAGLRSPLSEWLRDGLRAGPRGGLRAGLPSRP